MKRSIAICVQYLLSIVLLLPLVYGHEEGAQAISKKSIEGPLYAFIIIISAMILARFIKKSDANQNVEGGKSYGGKR